MNKKAAYNLHFDLDILRLEAKLDDITEDQEECFKMIDMLQKHIDIYDEQWCETNNKILELKKDNRFKYYCTYGKFPND